MASKTKQTQTAIMVPAARWALRDEYLQRQLRNATSQVLDLYGQLLDLYGRVSRRPKAKADKEFYRRLTNLAVSVGRAVGWIEEPPPPPSHRRRNILLVAVVASGGTVLLLKRARAHREELPTEGAVPLDSSESGDGIRAETPAMAGGYGGATRTEATNQAANQAASQADGERPGS